VVETPAAGPWDEPAPAPPAPPAAPPRQTLIWNIVSTAILVGWLSWLMGWVWGVAAVFGVFVHEFGHLLVINALGFGPSTIRIIPFLGGAATIPKAPDTDFKSILISLSGPVFGLIAAVPFFVASSITGDVHWLGGAFFIAGFNLLNLAPAPPLDGSKALGPVLARIHPMVERVALVAVGAAAVAWTIGQQMWLAAIFIGLSVLASLRTRNLRPNARPLGWGEWAGGLGLYLGAAALCLGVMVAASAGAGMAAPLLSFGSLGGHS
jgi:Zn-dependent protease